MSAKEAVGLFMYLIEGVNFRNGEHEKRTGQLALHVVRCCLVLNIECVYRHGIACKYQ